MSKLLELIRADSENAQDLIGIRYDEYLHFIGRTVPKDQIPASIAQDFTQIPSRSNLRKVFGRLFEGFRQAPSQQRSNQYEVAIAPSLVAEDTLSLPDQYLLLLFFLRQDWLQEMSVQLGVSQAALLGFYFNTSEAVVNDVFCNCTPLIKQLSTIQQLKLDSNAMYLKLQNATAYANDAQQRLRLFQKLGFCPSCIFDIGGSNGSWTRVVHQLFPKAHYHLFEPLAPFSVRYQQGLELTKKQVDCTIHPYALGAEQGTATIAITPDLVGSSILVDYQSDYFPTSEEIRVTTVDAVIQEKSLPYPQLIKMDTQGFELSILKGAVKTLKHVEVLAIETWLARGYGEKTPLLFELTAWLAQHDFVLFDIGGGYRDTSGILIAPDCFFVNKSSPLIQNKQNRIVNLDWVK